MGRRDPRFDAIYQLENAASSTYHGLSVTLTRRLASEVAFSASYTLSKTLDDASDFDEQPQNPFNLQAERALSRQHQEQRFVFNALFDLPFGEEENGAKPQTGASRLVHAVLGDIELAPILTVGTGRPVNPLTGLDSDRSRAIPLAARPLDFGRNSLLTGSIAALDLRVVKYFKVGEHGK